MIDIQKILDDHDLSEDCRARLEAFALMFEPRLRELLDAQPTVAAKEEALSMAQRILEEIEQELEVS